MKVTQIQLSKKLGVTRQRVCNMVRAGLITPDADGKFELDEVLKTIADNRDASRGGKRTPAAPGDGSFYESRARKEAALANLRELEAQEKAGQLVNGQEVRFYLAAMFTTVKTRLRSIPATVAGELAHIGKTREGRAATAEIARALLRAIDDALTGLAAWTPKEKKNAKKPNTY